MDAGVGLVLLTFFFERGASFSSPELNSVGKKRIMATIWLPKI